MNFKYLGVVMAAAMSIASAAPVTLNLAANGSAGTVGNSLTFTNGAVIATVTAWTIMSNPTTTGTFVKSAVGQYTAGLGVCNSAEITVGCTSPNHTMDNAGEYDFLLFQFNTPVSPASVVLNAFSTTDTDISYWTGNASLPLTLLLGKTLANMGLGSEQQNLTPTAAGTTPRTASLTSGNVTSLLISANIANLDGIFDYIKLQSLTVTTPSSAVPEPGTMGLLGVALAGLGALRLRRRA